MPRIVLIGTGTNVGKTFVAEAVSRALARRGHSVQALKPIETGVDGSLSDPEPPCGTDAARLEAASLHVKPPRPHPLHRFARPVSPHLAAAEARIELKAAAVAAWANTTLRDTTPRTPRTWQLIETAGGVFSPLSLREDNFDLARALDPSVWVLVAHDGLGVLHDVRSTLLAMSTRGRSPDYLVLSAGRPQDASTGTNARELARLGVTPAPFCELHRNAPEGVEPLVDALLAP